MTYRRYQGPTGNRRSALPVHLPLNSLANFVENHRVICSSILALTVGDGIYFILALQKITFYALLHINDYKNDNDHTDKMLGLREHDFQNDLFM